LREVWTLLEQPLEEISRGFSKETFSGCGTIGALEVEVVNGGHYP
jgi:hypothetical protein